jgi:hypothetical protein
MLVYESKRLMWHSCFKIAYNYISISVARLTAGFIVHLVQLCLAYHCRVLVPASLSSCYCVDVEIYNSYHQVACNCTFHSCGLHYRLRCSVWYLLHAGSLRYYHFLVLTYYFLSPPQMPHRYIMKVDCLEPKFHGSAAVFTEFSLT